MVLSASREHNDRDLVRIIRLCLDTAAERRPSPSCSDHSSQGFLEHTALFIQSMHDAVQGTSRLFAEVFNESGTVQSSWNRPLAQGIYPAPFP
jgi:hypothetical protein